MTIVVSFAIGIPDTRIETFGGKDAAVETVTKICDVAIRTVARGLSQSAGCRAKVLVGKDAHAPDMVSVSGGRG